MVLYFMAWFNRLGLLNLGQFWPLFVVEWRIFISHETRRIHAPKNAKVSALESQQDHKLSTATLPQNDWSTLQFIFVGGHCYSEISHFSSRRAEFGRLAVLGCTENLPEPLDGVTV